MAIEKIWEPEYKRPVLDSSGKPKKDDRGLPVEETVRPWRIEATGKDVNELRGAFDQSGGDLFVEGQKDWEAHGGDVEITRPDGSVDTVRADLLDRYRAKPGFCRTRVRPGMVIDGFGGMRARGLTRFKAVYRNGTRIVLEER